MPCGTSSRSRIRAASRIRSAAISRSYRSVSWSSGKKGGPSGSRARIASSSSGSPSPRVAEIGQRLAPRGRLAERLCCASSQSSGLDQVELVQRQEHRRAAFAARRKQLEEQVIFLGGRLAGVDHEQDHVALFQGLSGFLVHQLAQLMARPVQPRRIDKYDLGACSAHSGSGCPSGVCVWSAGAARRRLPFGPAGC